MKIKEFIVASWKGEQDFKTVYKAPAIVLLSLRLFLAVLHAIHHLREGIPNFEAVAITFDWISILFLICWAVLLIKCSDNANWKGWSVIAGMSFLPIFLIPYIVAFIVLLLK